MSRQKDIDIEFITEQAEQGNAFPLGALLDETFSLEERVKLLEEIDMVNQQRRIANPRLPDLVVASVEVTMDGMSVKPMNRVDTRLLLNPAHHPAKSLLGHMATMRLITEGPIAAPSWSSTLKLGKHVWDDTPIVLYSEKHFRESGIRSRRYVGWQ